MESSFKWERDGTISVKKIFNFQKSTAFNKLTIFAEFIRARHLEYDQ
jgi:hypothetical protein